MRRIRAQNTTWLWLCLFVLSTAGAVAHSPEKPVCHPALSQNIPSRARSAMTGSAFARSVAGMSESQREQAILVQLSAGNVPDFLRRLHAVRLRHTFADNKTVTATVCVTPDYLAIGSDADFLRIPMNLYTATAVASRFGFILPTPKLVDTIYEQSTYHLKPEPMTPGPQMRSTAYYQTHNRKIKAQHLARGIPLGALVSGHKKDVVMTNRSAHKPGSLAIYGWHRRAGLPIQPLSTVHGARYADYSHGIRLVSNTVWIDGHPWSMYKVLQHPVLAKVLSTEGALFTLPQFLSTPSAQQLTALDLR